MKAAIVFVAIMAIIFVFAYGVTALAVDYIMSDYEPRQSLYVGARVDGLEVKTNDGGVQHRQVYVEQAAKNVQAQ